MNRCVRNSSGQISYTDRAKLAVWKEHYGQLLNGEFLRDSYSLSPAFLVEVESIEPVGKISEIYLEKLFNETAIEGKVSGEKHNRQLL